MADYVFEDPFDDSLEDIRQNLLQQVEDIWPDANNRPDIREGSLMWTLLSPIAFEIQRFQADLNVALELGFLQFTFGEFLDLRGIELGVSRKEGSNATGILRFLGDIGTEVPVGTSASTAALTEDQESYQFSTTDAGIITGVNDPVSLNEVQELRVDGTADFTITFDGQTTGALPYNANAAQIQTALEGLSNIGTGNINVIGSALSGATVEFINNLEYKDLPLMEINPIKINEIQSLKIQGSGGFRILFDGSLSDTELTESSYIQDFIDTINSEVAQFSTTYPDFTVTTSTWDASTNSPMLADGTGTLGDLYAVSVAGTQNLGSGSISFLVGDFIQYDGAVWQNIGSSVDVTNTFNIIFGGSAEYKDVPLISIIASTGSTITPSSTTLVQDGADLTGVVTEIQKGRDAKPKLTYAIDVNEKQSLGFTPASLKVDYSSSGLGLGSAGARNRVELLSFDDTPTTGDFKLNITTDGGVTWHETSSIYYNDTIGQLKSVITGTPFANINFNDISVTSYPLSANYDNINDAGAAFKIEYINNLRYSNNVRLAISDNNLKKAGNVAVVPNITVLQTASEDGSNSRQKLHYASTQRYDSLGNVSEIKSLPASGGNFKLRISDGSKIQLVPNTSDTIPYNVSATKLQNILNSTTKNPFFGGESISEVKTFTQTNPSGWTSGSYRITFDNGINNEITGDIAYNASPAAVQAALIALPNGVVEPGDITVTGDSDLSSNGNVFTITFGGRYARNNMPNPGFTFSNGSTPVSGSPSDISVVTVTDGVSYLFEEGSFSVSGGSLVDENGLVIEFTGGNANKLFAPIQIVYADFDGIETSGDLVFKTQTGTLAGTIDLYDIDLSTKPLTQDIEAAFNDPIDGLGAGAVDVRVATGFQTLEKTSAPTGTFTITIDNGFESLTTTSLSTDIATSADIENAINALAFTSPSPYSPSVRVVGSGVVDDPNNIFKIYFDSATEHVVGDGPLSYKSIIITSTETFSVGPSLTDKGAIYEIEYVGDGGSPYDVNNDVKEKNIALTASIAATDFQPTIIQKSTGGTSTNTKYFVMLGHPAGYIELKVGSGDTYITSPISVGLDTAESIKYKLEELTSIGSGNLTVTGGPFGSNPIVIEFSGGTLSGVDQPMIEVHDGDTHLFGGSRVGLIEDTKGFGSGGDIEDVACSYVYTLVTKLGVQDGVEDTDYEAGYGETKSSPQSDPTTILTGNKVKVDIEPVIQNYGLNEIKAIKVYRSIDGSTYKLIGNIPEEDLKTTALGDDPTTTTMSIVDNIPELTFNGITQLTPDSNTTGVLELTAVAEEILDVDGNINGALGNVDARTIENLDDIINGVNRVTNPEPFGGGSNIEDDESYRTRLIEFAQKDPGAGNIDDYVSWAKEIAGVEGVAVIPEWQEIYGPTEGPGTVKVIVSGVNSTAVSDEVIEAVRSYIAGTIAIPDPDQVYAPAIDSTNVTGGSVEAGTYEYVHTYINVGKGETKPSAPAKVVVGGSDNAVDVYLTIGQSGIGTQNTVGRRVYRRKLNLDINDDVEAGKFCLVAEILDNTTTKFTDIKSFADMAPPAGPYQRRKAPVVNSTSLFDGVAPIGAHVSIESITDETVWVSAEIYPTSGWSVDGSGGRSNLTTALDIILENYFISLPSGQDVKISSIMNILHDHPGVADFRNVRLYSPLYPTGTSDNIPIGPGVTAVYSSAGSFTTWLNYPYDT